jgi:hypothetical protein
MNVSLSEMFLKIKIFCTNPGMMTSSILDNNGVFPGVTRPTRKNNPWCIGTIHCLHLFLSSDRRVRSAHHLWRARLTLNYLYQSMGSMPLTVSPLFTLIKMGTWLGQLSVMPHLTNSE